MQFHSLRVGKYIPSAFPDLGVPRMYSVEHGIVRRCCALVCPIKVFCHMNGLCFRLSFTGKVKVSVRISQHVVSELAYHVTVV